MMVRVDCGNRETEINVVGYEGKTVSNHVISGTEGSSLPTVAEVVGALAISHKAFIEVNTLGRGQALYEHLSHKFKDVEVIGTLL